MVIAVAYKDNEIFEHFGHAEMFAIYKTNEDQTELVSVGLWSSVCQEEGWQGQVVCRLPSIEQEDNQEQISTSEHN